MAGAFQDTGFAFQGTGVFAFQTVSGVTPPTPDAGQTPAGSAPAKKRRKVVIADRWYLVDDRELAYLLSELVRRPEVKIKRKRTAIKELTPERVEVPDEIGEPQIDLSAVNRLVFDALLAQSIRLNTTFVADMLRRLARAKAEDDDEREVEELLLMGHL
jgi:hypothetical protein